MFVAFQGGVLIGSLVGSNFAASLGLEFSVPLIFLALLIPSLRHRSMYVSVAVAVLATLALVKLPYMLGVFIAALLAIAAGYLHMERTERSD
jgi:predicted branched-subunit amino acid permease